MEIVSQALHDEVTEYVNGNREADNFIWTGDDGEVYATYDEVRISYVDSNGTNAVVLCYQGHPLAMEKYSLSQAISLQQIPSALHIGMASR